MAVLRLSCLGVLALSGLVQLSSSLSVMAAAPPSGVAVAVVQQAEANGNGGDRVLQADAPVYSGDAIVTGPIGSAQVKFIDNTKLVVGPNSRLVINSFVFNSDNTAKDLSINALKGAFRFISGNSNHDAYKITTPTATIGVRGTEVDITVGAGTVVYEGQVEVCKRVNGQTTKSCVTITGGCDLATFDNGNVQRVSEKADRNKILVEKFKYAVDQRPLLPEFRTNVASCGNLAPKAAPIIIEPDQTQPIKVQEKVKEEPPAASPTPEHLTVTLLSFDTTVEEKPTEEEEPPPDDEEEPDKCDYHPRHHHHHGHEHDHEHDDEHDHDKTKHWPDHDWPHRDSRGWPKDGSHHDDRHSHWESPAPHHSKPHGRDHNEDDGSHHRQDSHDEHASTDGKKHHHDGSNWLRTSDDGSDHRGSRHDRRSSGGPDHGQGGLSWHPNNDGGHDHRQGGSNWLHAGNSDKDHRRGGSNGWQTASNDSGHHQGGSNWIQNSNNNSEHRRGGSNGNQHSSDDTGHRQGGSNGNQHPNDDTGHRAGWVERQPASERRHRASAGWVERQSACERRYRSPPGWVERQSACERRHRPPPGRVERQPACERRHRPSAGRMNGNQHANDDRPSAGLTEPHASDDTACRVVERQPACERRHRPPAGWVERQPAWTMTPAISRVGERNKTYERR